MLRSGVILLVLGIAVFCGERAAVSGRTKKVHCAYGVLAMLLVGNGIWNANRYFDLGIGCPFCGKLAKTAPSAAFHGQRPAKQH